MCLRYSLTWVFKEGQVFNVARKPVMWFAVQIKCLVSKWNAKMDWNEFFSYPFPYLARTYALAGVLREKIRYYLLHMCLIYAWEKIIHCQCLSYNVFTLNYRSQLSDKNWFNGQLPYIWQGLFKTDLDIGLSILGAHNLDAQIKGLCKFNEKKKY